MSNRFDDMRVKGINTNDATATAGDILSGKTAYARGQKITGSLVPSGGDDYNVFMQATEPISKDGVWIKRSGTVNNVIFLNAGSEGDFLVPDDFAYLMPESYAVGQIIINGKLYIFGTSTSTSWVYDLKTKQKSHINVPTITTGYGVVGACYYNGYIYVFYGNINWYKYDISTNTYTELPYISDSESGYCTNMHVYNGCVYFYTNNAHASFYSSQIIYYSYIKKVNLETGEMTYLSEGSHNSGGYNRVPRLLRWIWSICLLF